MQTGDLVEVRSKEEILRTLDNLGRLEGLPFMPQMFEYCGKRFRIYKRAHKTCDSVTVSGGGLRYIGRKMERTVFLEDLRCNGASYGGCNASCLIFWKEAWLKDPDRKEPPLPNHFGPKLSKSDPPICTEEAVRAGTRSATQNTFACQATQLSAATTPLSPFDLRIYLEDYRSGNVRIPRMLASFLYVGYAALCNAGIKLGRPLRLFYDFFQGLYGGVPYPRKPGLIPLGQPTPIEKLDLRPGELVRVRSQAAILKTLDRYGRNRGMYFVADQVPYCGRTFRVFKRVDQIIDERSGRMIKMKTPAFLLEGAICGARYTEFCLFCPRSTYPYWREIWLERATDPAKEMKERAINPAK
jgi:hypothetical protein